MFLCYSSSHLSYRCLDMSNFMNIIFHLINLNRWLPFPYLPINIMSLPTCPLCITSLYLSLVCLQLPPYSCCLPHISYHPCLLVLCLCLPMHRYLIIILQVHVYLLGTLILGSNIVLPSSSVTALSAYMSNSPTSTTSALSPPRLDLVVNFSSYPL